MPVERRPAARCGDGRNGGCERPARTRVRQGGRLCRLRRIDGQARGLRRMVAEERFCLDILAQVLAMTKVLRSVALDLLGSICVMAWSRRPRPALTKPGRSSAKCWRPLPGWSAPDRVAARSSRCMCCHGGSRPLWLARSPSAAAYGALRGGGGGFAGFELGSGRAPSGATVPGPELALHRGRGYTWWGDTPAGYMPDWFAPREKPEGTHPHVVLLHP